MGVEDVVVGVTVAGLALALANRSTVLGSTSGSGSALSPSEVEKRIRAGDLSSWKNGRISKWFQWKEAFVNRTGTEIRNMSDMTATLQNIQRQARHLDIIRDRLGEPMGVSSWYRTNSGNHKTGLATDFKGNFAKHNRIFNAALAVNYPGRSGKTLSPNADVFNLHLDLLPVGGSRTRHWAYNHSGGVISANLFSLRNSAVIV